MPSVSGVGSIPSNEECGIKDVWKHNLEEEFRTIRQVCFVQFFYIRYEFFNLFFIVLK